MPPEYFIDDLMTYLKLPYYVGLLSAAQFHGAAHKQPQQFQVITNKTRSMVNCGQAHIVFIGRKNVELMPTQLVNTSYGSIRVAIPEVTAMDLVTYPHHCIGINHVATVLSELAEKLTSDGLIALAEKTQEITWLH